MRDLHALRQQRGKRHVCSARVGDNSHVDVRFLWLQQALQEGRLKVLCVPTSENLSDKFTKSLSEADADRCYHPTENDYRQESFVFELKKRNIRNLMRAYLFELSKAVMEINSLRVFFRRLQISSFSCGTVMDVGSFFFSRHVPLLCRL